MNQCKINLYGTNSYGFGIAGSTLQYSSQNYHRFDNSYNNLDTFTVGNVGINNTVQWVDLEVWILLVLVVV